MEIVETTPLLAINQVIGKDTPLNKIKRVLMTPIELKMRSLEGEVSWRIVFTGNVLSVTKRAGHFVIL